MFFLHSAVWRKLISGSSAIQNVPPKEKHLPSKHYKEIFQKKIGDGLVNKRLKKGKIVTYLTFPTEALKHKNR